MAEAPLSDHMVPAAPCRSQARPAISPLLGVPTPRGAKTSLMLTRAAAGGLTDEAAMSLSSSRVVICGAGIAGVAAAYHLAVDHGLDKVVLVDEGNPLSLTSDKSTEAYRNWWPGPDWAMTAFMNRSIDLIEGIARATGNRINLNRRGYVFATADVTKIPFLETMAKTAEAHGGGPRSVSRSGAERLYAVA